MSMIGGQMGGTQDKSNGGAVRSRPLSRVLSPIALHFALMILAAVFVLPFGWIVLTSLKPDKENVAIPPKWYPVAMTSAQYDAAKKEGKLTPFQERYGFPPTFTHYGRAFSEKPLLLWVRNTLTIVVFSTLGTLISCTLAAYAFARLRWPDRSLLFAIVLGTMMLPFQVTLIPMFVLFRALHWVDTPLPLIVPAFFGSAFFIFLLRQFFQGLPEELMEAARIDGAGELFILTRIVVPLSKPAMLTVAIFSSMWAWNDFLGPLIYLSSESQKTLAVGLQAMVSQYGSEWGMFMASATVMIVPIVVLFFFAQRYFIEGIAVTGMKG